MQSVVSVLTAHCYSMHLRSRSAVDQVLCKHCCGAAVVKLLKGSIAGQCVLHCQMTESAICSLLLVPATSLVCCVYSNGVMQLNAALPCQC
jgi:hypothetical protein